VFADPQSLPSRALMVYFAVFQAAHLVLNSRWQLVPFSSRPPLPFAPPPEGWADQIVYFTSGIAGATSIDMDVFGLTPGENYLFQTYWEANDHNQVATMTFEGTDVETGITGNGTVGVLIGYTFTAGDNTLDVEFVPTAWTGGATTNMWLQGYSLQAIPEPSTGLLLTLGLVGLGMRRRGSLDR
jgi:hypothetical protein